MINNIHRSPQIRPAEPPVRKTDPRQVGGPFQSFLQEALKETDTKSTSVTISNHAQKRLEQHGFTLNDEDMNRLEEAVNTLEAKGSEQSLILYDDLALIASIKNKTVITALKSTEMTDVTNIDSAIQINGKR
ncbi:TIGR02530 family flagellar biosynthesis protein [Alkalibacterium sp. MB6]|uniref:TIGR02530 family flagellar biosynthesis protein n=1 Tax=Alkalibacterium sp. MB6 TaxID=2081965 RepID=UPI0013795568|nr:TIGR02530 family flagellar biosynthesis protein [Alkalibacterium sp. MB6]